MICMGGQKEATVEEKPYDVLHSICKKTGDTTHMCDFLWFDETTLELFGLNGK